MAEVLGHDIGYTLWVRCDRCDRELMAFGREAVRQTGITPELRAELEAMVRAEGWEHTSGVGWLCERCGSGGLGGGPCPELPNAEPRRCT